MRDQRPGYGNSLALAARHFIGKVAGPLRQPDLMQDLRGPLQALLLPHPGIEQGKCHIFKGIQAWQQVEGLEHKTDLPAPDG